ncbi:hypothetical protein [Paraburkholderia fungorum]|uniref:hypothetical protein n=1 Tax=Paraburkholderia fungorum TaxID=134537 RepID=UPI001C1EE255|nr:hypothetical protein [Paraburkholderia fungorum]MBU7436519.1 hypothetical protein [Paraburkholderia fungorum]
MAILAAIPIAAYVAAATAAVSAYGAMASAHAQAETASAAANAAKYNQEVATQQAAVVNQQAAANADASERQSDQTLGMVAAASAQNGTGLSGSTGALYEQDATNAEMTAMNIRYNGQLQGVALENGANLDQYQSQVDTMNANNATAAGYVGAGSAVLSSAGGYYNNSARLGYYGTRYGGYASGGLS